MELLSCLTLLPLYQVLSGELGMKNSQDTERVVGLHDFKCNLMFIDMSKVFKDNKPLGRVQFVVFEKFTNTYLHQIAQEIMLFPINSLYEKKHPRK